MARYDSGFVAARSGAVDALTRYDWQLLQSQHAATQIARAWGLEPQVSRDLVAAERRRRAAK